MKKKCLLIMLGLILLAVGFVGSALAETTQHVNSCADLEIYIPTADVILLNDDIIMSNGYPIEINHNVTIRGAGKTLSRGARVFGAFFTVSDGATVRFENVNFNGMGNDSKIKAKYADAGFINIAAGSTVYLDGVQMYNNKTAVADTEGTNGSAIHNEGTLYLNNVSVTNCTAAQSATGYGGQGAVYLGGSAVMHVTGNVQINGNTGVNNMKNVYLSGAGQIQVDSGYSTSSSIGVYTGQSLTDTVAVAVGNSRTISGSPMRLPTGGEANTFFCDASTLGVSRHLHLDAIADNNTLHFCSCVNTVTYNANGGSGSVPASHSDSHTSNALTIQSNSLTKEDYVTRQWNTQPDGTGTGYSGGQSHTSNDAPVAGSTLNLFAMFDPRLKVEGSDYTGVYDAQSHGLPVTCNYPEAVIYYSVNGGAETTSYPTITDAGTKTVTVRATLPDQDDAVCTYTLVVTQAPVTITVDKKFKTYGEADPTFTSDISGVMDGETILYTVGRTPDETLGEHPVTATVQGSYPNYDIAIINGSLTITTSTDLTVTGTDYEGTYDGAEHGSAASASKSDATITYSTDGGSTWSSTVPTITHAGSETVLVKAVLYGYEDATFTYTLKVNPKEAAIAAIDNHKYYDEPDPVLESTVSGTIGDEKLVYTVARDSGEDVGNYPIRVTPTAGANPDYAITTTDANFEIIINPGLSVSGTDYSGDYDAAYHGVAAVAKINGTETAAATLTYSIQEGIWQSDFPQVKDVANLTVLVKATLKGYTDAQASYTLTVAAIPASITAQNQQKKYGESDPVLIATVTGTIAGESLNYSIARDAGEDAGSYNINITESGNTNYIVSKYPAVFTIEASNALTVDGTDYEGVYDGQPHGEAAIASVSGATLEYSTDGGAIWVSTFPQVTHVADSTAVMVRAFKKNYVDAYGDYTLTVLPKPATITADPAGKTFGEGDPVLTATVEGTVGTETLVYTVERTAGETVGTYPITVTAPADQNPDYAVTTVPGEFTIGKSSALTVSGTGYNEPYDGESHGDAAQAAIAGTPTTAATITYSTDGGTTWSSVPPTVKDATPTAITVKVKAVLDGYEDAEGEYTLYVAKRDATITAIDKQKTYGEADPELTATTSGVVSGETLIYTLKRDPGESVGQYPIDAEFNESDNPNYNITVKPATLTIISSKELTVSGTDYNGPYDGASHGTAAIANKTGAAISYSTDNVNWSSAYPTVKDVADSTTVYVKATLAGYEDATGQYTLTVTQAPAIITCDEKQKAYHEDDPELTAQVSGTIGSETLSYTLSRDPGESIGSYKIDATPGSNPNYSITVNPAQLTIVANGSLTVSGTDYTGAYDGQSHGGAASASQPEAVIQYSTDGGKTWVTTPPTVKDVSDSTTVLVKATLEGYTGAEGSYTLTVTKRAAKITADQKVKAFGEADPELTAQTSNVVTGETLIYTLSRDPGEALGDYPIRVSASADDNPNYELELVDNILTITKNGTLTVKGTGWEGPYDKQTHGTAAVASHSAAVLSYSKDGGTTWQSDYPTISHVSETAHITVKAELEGYDTAYDEYDLIMTPLPVTITVEDAEKYSHAPDPEFEAEVTGVLEGDEIEYTFKKDEDEEIGKHEITVELGDNPDYDITVVPGVLDIKPNKGLSVEGKDYEGAYDGRYHGDPAKAYIDDRENAKIIVSYSLDGGTTWQNDYPQVRDIDDNVTVKVRAEMNDYEPAYNEYTLKVTPIPVTVTAENKRKYAGKGDPELTAVVEGLLDPADVIEYTLRRNEGEWSGYFAILPEGEKRQGNYEVKYVPGLLYIRGPLPETGDAFRPGIIAGIGGIALLGLLLTLLLRKRRS